MRMRKTLDQVVDIGAEAVGVRGSPAPNVMCRIRLFVPERIGQSRVANGPLVVPDCLPALPILVLSWKVVGGMLVPGWLESYVGLLQMGIAGLPFPVTLIERFCPARASEVGTVRRVFFGTVESGKTLATFQSISPDSVEEAIGERLEEREDGMETSSSEETERWRMDSKEPIAVSSRHGPCYPTSMTPTIGIGTLGEAIHRMAVSLADAGERKPLLDKHIEYTGYHGRRSICRVRVYDPNGSTGKRPLVVIFTELADNPGTSITNRIEHLAMLLWRRLGSPEPPPVFIEHYPNRGLYNKVRNRWQFPEEFDFVELERGTDGVFRSPTWRRTSRMTVEVIIGQRLND